MSSHHIVREKQEPALLILGLDNFDEELLGQLLEWSPTVMTTPDTAEQINSQGIKVDILISNETDIAIQSDIKLIPAGDKPMKAAMDFLLTSAYTAVNIVTDDLQLNELAAYADKINVVVFCGNQKIYPIASGFSKWKLAGERIMMLTAAEGLHTTGLTVTETGRYITTADGFFTLAFSAPFVFIAEDI